jgi:hypothetical protein
LVDALLRDRSYVDQAGIAEHAEVLRHLRLPQPEAPRDLPHRARPVPEQLDDAETIRFGQGRQRGVHAPNIPLKEYTCQGIFDTDT